MTLVILDPNLEGEAGHHLAYDMAIAREARARGEAVTIVAHRRFPAASIEDVRIVPHFTASTYAELHRDPVTGAMDDWRHFNDLLQAELAALPRSQFGPSDAVLVPTATENHLAGYIGWMKGFDPLDAPLFLLHLMFPSGVTVDAAGEAVVEDRLRALFYRLADRAAQEQGPPIHVFASGGQHATEYSALFARPIAAHPVPIRPEPGPARDTPPRRALLFAGDARIDKGMALLPELVPRLAAAHPDWRLVAHVNANHAWGAAKAAAEALAALPGLELTGGRLAQAQYLALARGVGLALFPYDPELYRRKSSGVLWEAISLGAPVVVPAGTWLENEARHWGAGHVAYAGQTVGAIAAAFAEALPHLAELTALSAQAGLRYRAANGAAALLDQIAALWVRHKATASLVARPTSVAIDLGRLDEGWHRPESLEGRPIRWSMQDPVIAFDWPFEEAWQIDVSLLSFTGPEQLDRIVVQADGQVVNHAWQREGRGARLTLRGAGPGRARPRIAVRLRLPSTMRPNNDARDLGILVGAMRLGPADGAAADVQAPPPAGAPVLRVGTPPGAGGGWAMTPAVAGDLEAPQDVPCLLVFRLRAEPAGPAPGIRLNLGGAGAGLRLTQESDGAWLGTATLPPALLRLGGERVAWSLHAEAGAGQVVTLLSVEASSLAGTTRPIDPARSLPVLPQPADAPALPPPDGPRMRWDLSQGIGPAEGPFPDLGVPADVRWVVARDARLAVETNAAGPVRLALRYRCLLPRQRMRVTLDSRAPMSVEVEGAGLKQSGEIVLDLTLQAGMNTLALAFEAGVEEPGTGRELVLLLERAAFG